MSEIEASSVNDGAHAQLVAYLDGELDSEGSRQVEEQLAHDANLRDELQRLQRTWDLLDELPRADVGTDFTQTTVEVVALSAEQELVDTKTAAQRGRTLVWAIAGAGVLLIGAASYFAVAAYLQRPTTQLARDYPIIQDIDLYTIADSVEFLHQLDDESLFAQEDVDDGL